MAGWWDQYHSNLLLLLLFRVYFIRENAERKREDINCEEKRGWKGHLVVIKTKEKKRKEIKLTVWCSSLVFVFQQNTFIGNYRLSPSCHRNHLIWWIPMIIHPSFSIISIQKETTPGKLYEKEKNLVQDSFTFSTIFFLVYIEDNLSYRSSSSTIRQQ